MIGFIFASSMQEKRAITALDDIRLLVDTFYGKVRQDELLGPIFASVITGDWQPHLDTMYRFWQSVLLKEPTYNGAPFPPHVKLPIGKEHFDRWLMLWRATVDDFFDGELAEEARWRAGKMAELFIAKLDYYRGGVGGR